MLLISISLTLLAILASLYFLAKVNRENLGSFSKWMTYLVLAAAGVVLIIQIAGGIMCLTRCGGKYGRAECYSYGKCGSNGCESKDGQMGCGNDRRGGMHHGKMTGDMDGCCGGGMNPHKMKKGDHHMIMEKDSVIIKEEEK